MELTQLQDEVGEWSCRNFPNNEPIDPLLGLVEEVGELAHAVLKARQGIRGTPQEHYDAMVDAVGDIVVYLADFCERNAIDLGLAVETTWMKVRQRDWKADPAKGGEG
jgi:NTP pyrophosphatase (non-canonical NTP hydrolase)